MLTIKQFSFNPIQENTYVIFTPTGACLIVDPGCYFDYERKELTDFLDASGLQPKCLLNTHCHFDHVFGNRFIAEKYRLVPHIHLLEKPVLDHAAVSGLRWNLPFDNYEGELVFLRENEDLLLDEYAFRILFTPGHSPGSLSFYCAAEKAVLSGDVLFRAGIGRTDLPGGDYHTLISSIRQQLFVLPDDTVVYPGHGPVTTIGYESKNNPFLSEK